MRATISWLLSATLLAVTTVASAQPLPCASIAGEVRDRVREAGACTDAIPGDGVPRAVAPMSSDTVTVTLSDGTVVRIPRELSSGVSSDRKRAANNGAAARKGAARASAPSAQAPPNVSGNPTPAPQKFTVPDVIGRNFGDAAGALTEFKVDRIETASAAPSGEVVAQEPAPATLMLPGGTVSLQVSDGSLASPKETAAVAATEAVPTPAPPPARVSASDPAEMPPSPERFSIAFTPDAALILGAGVLLGLLSGSLLMYLLLRRRFAGADTAVSLTPSSGPQPVETYAVVTSDTEAPEIKFAARLVPVETTIAFAQLPDADEVAVAHASDHYA